MKMISINIAGKLTLMKEGTAKHLANELATKGIYADITGAHYDHYEVEINRLADHLSDMRKLVGASYGITL